MCCCDDELGDVTHIPAGAPPPGTLGVQMVKPAGPMGIVIVDAGPDASRGMIKRMLIQTPGPVAQAAGLYTGDQIVAINGNMVTADMPLNSLLAVLRTLRAGAPFTVFIVPSPNRPVAPVVAQPASVPMAQVVQMPTGTPGMAQVAPMMGTPPPAAVQMGTPQVGGNRFDTETGEELPKFDPNTGVQNW